MLLFFAEFLILWNVLRSALVLSLLCGNRKREEDKRDRRSVIVRKTPGGTAYMRTLGGYLTAAAKVAKKG